MAETQLKTGTRTLLELAAGAVIGFVISCVGGPRVISWWYAPPSQDAFSCAGSVKDALAQFVLLQLGLAVAGGIALALTLFFGRRFLKKRRESKTV
jgi:Mg/Co/Ni transporter MgtE